MRNTSSKKPIQPLNEGTKSYKFYNSISTLPLRNYKEVLIRKNLAALTIEGFPPETELAEAWQDIQEQYAEAIGDGVQREYLRKLRNVTNLNVDFTMVQMAVQQLSIIIPYHLNDPRDPEFKFAFEFYRTDLNRLVSANFQFDNPATYGQELQRCLNRAKGIKIELDLQTLNFEAFRNKMEKEKEPDDKYFDSILISLSDLAGYHLNDQITVFEFCERLNRAKVKS